MRDLSNDRALLSINSMTVKPWSLVELVEGCARAGISAISPWRDIVQACGVERAAKLIRAHAMTVTGLCRGGMFPAADAAGRRAALDDNRRAVDEAAAIGAQCLILVVGGLPKGSRDIDDARRQVRDALAALLPYARQAKVPLAIEPLHPMFAADRACVNTLAHANDLCDELGAGVGIAVDTYHVWWDPDLEDSGRARGGEDPGLSRQRLAGADHRSAARSRHDGRRRHRPAGDPEHGGERGLSRPLRGGNSLRRELVEARSRRCPARLHRAASDGGVMAQRPLLTIRHPEVFAHAGKSTQPAHAWLHGEPRRATAPDIVAVHPSRPSLRSGTSG